MTVIDSDGHVVESEAMFEELQREFYPRRPLLAVLPTDTERRDSNCCWIVEGKTIPKMGGRGRMALSVARSERARKIGNMGAQTLANVDDRLRDLDKMMIDIQVMFPTLFLAPVAEDVRLEAALFQAYNTYVGGACAKSNGRLRWVAPVSFRDPDFAVQEIHRVSDLGAAGIFTLGMVWDRTLAEESFFPIYAEAAALNLPICVHLGFALPQLTDVFSDGLSSFCSAVAPVTWGFWYVMARGLLGRFPKLRIGFFETGSLWVPYAIHQLRRRAQRISPSQGKTVTLLGAGGPGGIDAEHYRDPEELFRSGRAFVNCEGDEDLRYLIEHLGEDALMCSSDYPHPDSSSETDFVIHWRERTDVSDRVKEKALGENAARLFRL